MFLTQVIYFILHILYSLVFISSPLHFKETTIFMRQNDILQSFFHCLHFVRKICEYRKKILFCKFNLCTVIISMLVIVVQELAKYNRCSNRNSANMQNVGEYFLNKVSQLIVGAEYSINVNYTWLYVLHFQ